MSEDTLITSADIPGFKSREVITNSAPEPVEGMGTAAVRENVVLEPGQFKGDPRRVIGHPSNKVSPMVDAWAASQQAREASHDRM